MAKYIQGTGFEIKLPDVKKLMQKFLTEGYYVNGITPSGERWSKVNKTEIFDFLKELYTQMYNQTMVKGGYGYITSIKNYHPDNINLDDLISMGINGDVGVRGPYYFQDADLYGAKNYSDNFIHIFTPLIYGVDFENEQARLYLNLKTQNVVAFCKELIKKCVEPTSNTEKLYPYFKFADGKRTDQFILYCSAKNIKHYVKIFEEIKLEHPNLCENCEKLDINLGNINNWIGFGESSTESGHSYSSVRKEAVLNFLEDLEYKQKLNLKTLNVNDPRVVEAWNNNLLNLNVDPVNYVINNSNTVLKTKIIDKGPEPV